MLALNQTKILRNLISQIILIGYVLGHFVIWNVNYGPLLAIQSDIFYIMNWFLLGALILSFEDVFNKKFLKKSIFFLVMMIVLFIGSLFVGYGARSRAYTISQVPIYILIVLVSSTLHKNAVKWMFYALLALFSVYHILGIIGFLFKFDFFFGLIPNQVIDSYRYSSILTNPNAWGEFAFVSLFITLFFFVEDKKLNHLYLYIPMFGLIALSLLISLSRNAMMMTLVVYLCLLIYSKYLSKAFRRLLFIALFGAVLSLTILFVVKTEFALNFLRLNQGLTGRSELWRFVFHEFLRTPWFGVGFNNSSIAIIDSNLFDVSSTHSMYLGLLYEMGVFGFLIFMFWIIKRAFIYLHQAKLESPYRISVMMFLILWISFFIGQIFEFQFFKVGAINTFILVVIGLSYTLESRVKESIIPKKIIHIITGLESGGAESMLYKLILHRDSKKFDYTVISLTTLGAYGNRLKELGVHVIALNLGKPKMFKALYQSHKALKDSYTVQGWLYHGNLAALICCQLYGIDRLIWGIRQTDISFEHNKKSTMYLARFLSKLSFLPDVIESNSSSGIDSHVQIGYRKDKFKLVSNGFEVSKYAKNKKNDDAIRQSLGIQDEIIIGHVARFDVQKDQQTLFKALNIAKNKFNQPWKLVCLGIDMTNENQKLMDMIEENGLKDHVYLLGVRKDVQSFMSLFDLFVLSSLGEGFPNVLGEAMSSETPCVATNVGECEVIIGDTGIVVEKMNPEALAEGLIKLMNMNLSERETMGKNARIRIYEHFEMNQVARFYESYYLEE